MNYYPDCCYYDSSAAETEAEWYGAAGFTAEAFTRGGALWFLNGGEAHNSVWIQGENGPVLQGEAQEEIVYRFTMKPTGEEAAARVSVSFPEEQSFRRGGAEQICLPSGGAAELTPLPPQELGPYGTGWVPDNTMICENFRVSWYYALHQWLPDSDWLYDRERVAFEYYLDDTYLICIPVRPKIE